MAGVKISNLPPVPVAPALGDLLAEVQPAVGGVTYKVTLQQLQDLFVLNSGNVNPGLINQVAYYAATGSTVSGLATTSNATLVTSAGSVPSISQTLPTAVQANITRLGAQAIALNMNTHLINNVVDPVALQDAATKNYVDTVAAGLNVLPACYAATTLALTATYVNVSVPPSGVGATLTNAGAMAAFSIDGVSPPLASRVLIKNQASALQNGIYTVTAVGSGAVNWVLTRATDYDDPSEINPGDLVLINNGTVNKATGWVETATVTSVGVDNIDFSQFGAVTSFPITLAQGGTNANLTASNGGIFYSTATAGAILSGTATARQMLQSGASTIPAWSTATWPATTTANQILFSSATNTVSEVSGVVSSLLTTNTTGVPSLQSMAWSTYSPTVTLVGGAGNTVPVYSTNTGRFCRMGNTVFVEISLSGDGGAEGAGTGAINIALPVTASASGAVSVIRGVFTNGALLGLLQGSIASNGTTISFAYWNTISTTTTFVGNNQDNTTRIINAAFFYQVGAL